MAVIPQRMILPGAPHNPAPVWFLLRVFCIAAIALCTIGIALDLIEVLAPEVFEIDGVFSAVLLSTYFYYGPASWIVTLLMLGALLWLTYRLARNLHALAPESFSTSPTYAMAWYFIPIANFFMPPRMLDLIARTTSIAAQGSYDKRPVIGWWWAVCIAATVMSNVAASIAASSGAFSGAFDPAGYASSLWVNIMAGVMAIGAALLTLIAFGPIARLQSVLVSNWRERARPSA